MDSSTHKTPTIENISICSTSLSSSHASIPRAFAGGETGLQWLPLCFPGNVRVIVTATNPDASYVQLHEQRVQQHIENAHRPPVRHLSTVGSANCTGVGVGLAVERAAGEAEYESSHRRRKVYTEETGAFWRGHVAPHVGKIVVEPVL